MKITKVTDGLEIHSEREAIMHVDATPNREYPIRILMAHLSDCVVHSTFEEFAATMNRATAERNEWLTKAIAILGKHLA